MWRLQYNNKQNHFFKNFDIASNSFTKIRSDGIEMVTLLRAVRVPVRVFPVFFDDFLAVLWLFSSSSGLMTITASFFGLTNSFFWVAAFGTPSFPTTPLTTCASGFCKLTTEISYYLLCTHANKRNFLNARKFKNLPYCSSQQRLVHLQVIEHKSFWKWRLPES